MALLNKIRKDIKKSSYYVWFLGAQESKGLRGEEYITPVLKSLIQREKTVEPFKITLQVSHKGLKIIQNLNILNIKSVKNKSDSKSEVKPNKNDIIKHFIPHHAVTCVLQEDDIVACILLLYNPVTRCPVHVHAYRCDSIETASHLTSQLTTLIERPDNQKKLNEIEGRLRAKGLLLPTVPRINIPKRLNSSGSDGRSTTSPASESSGGSSNGCQQDRITNLYDSLAAELREKLGMGSDGKIPHHAPILLPPRDYDTVHRQKGNLNGIDTRRCLNENIVGLGVKGEAKTENDKKSSKSGPLGRVLGSSGGSSGIGSDHPPSPDQNGAYLDNQSTSDEEWTEQPSEDSLFLVAPGGRNNPNSWRKSSEQQLSLPRAKRVGSNEIEFTNDYRTPDSPSRAYRDPNDSPNRPDSGFRRSEENLLETIKESSKGRPEPRRKHEDVVNKRSGSPYRNEVLKQMNYNRKLDLHRSSPNLSDRKSESDKCNNEKMSQIANFRKRNEKGNMSPVGIVAPRRRIAEEQNDDYKKRIPGYKEKSKNIQDSYDKFISNEMKKGEEDVEQETRKYAGNTMKLSPHERFIDAKTKFLMLEKIRLEEQEKNIHNLEKKRYQEPPIAPEIIKSRSMWPRDEEGKKERPGLVRKNSFFDEDNRRVELFYDRERKRSTENSQTEIISEKREQINQKQVRRSDSRRRFSSRERLNDDIDYDIRYEPYPDEKRSYEEDKRRRESQEEEIQRRKTRSDFSPERRGGYKSPPREQERYRRKTPPSEEEEEERYGPKGRGRYEEQRGKYRNDPEPRRSYEEDKVNRRSYYDDKEDVPLDRYRSPVRRHRSEEEKRNVPFEKKSQFEIIENEKKLNSNALAKEFKRRSYPEQTEVEKRDRFREESEKRDRFREERGYDRSEVVRRRPESDLKRNSHELAKEFNRRSRAYSYEEEEEDSRRRRMGYQELDDRERFPGLDRATARHHVGERERYPAEGRITVSSQEDRYMDSPTRIPHLQVEKIPARYRHSYVEPGMPLTVAPSRPHDMLHRTNSTVSTSRIGMAAVHPY